ncbi:cytochrome C [Acidovorax carolinensis]|uniref:Cytochrome C n=1 Tax=Acidovorax carolinensis TaxID=553814 RepID=A0A240U8U0_9BURK|nr:cytochrome c [Acidovorax carolinensis]ART56559.1 cytochrome C [Acidovorax carolinensis]ART57473.1 cytochrome C [Acidovorax carolinensis]
MKTTRISTSRWMAAAALAGASLTSFAAETAAPSASSEVERGRYLATAGDCIACHTGPGGKPMAGGLSLASPLGSFYSTNITPSKSHGIGNYTLQQFTDALRHGKRADGANLYPAMPYTAYAKTSDEDIAAMYAYFMQGVEAVDAAPAQQTNLPFPFNIRALLGGWNALFHDARPYKADDSQTPEWNRGAYLAQGLAHCTTCHTPRTALMAEDSKRSLGGGEVGGWYAPNITSDVNSGIARWTEGELVQYMRGLPVPGKGPAAGPMAEAIDHSLKHLTAQDLKAIAVYIKSVPAVADGNIQQSADSFGQAKDDLDSIRGTELPKDFNAMTGAQLYDGYCASCHQAQGQGSDDDGLPALFRNTSLGHANSNNLVQVMLHGIHRVGTDSVMPGFAHELTDVQITMLGNYLLTSYGNPAAKVTEAQVAQLRDPAQPTGGGLLLLARVGVGIGVFVVLALMAWLLRRQRRRS